MPFDQLHRREFITLLGGAAGGRSLGARRKHVLGAFQLAATAILLIGLRSSS